MKTYLKYTFVLSAVLLVISNNAFCQSGDLLKNNAVRTFIVENCKYKDSNPIYQSELDSISCLIQNIVLLYDTDTEKDRLRAMALEMFYANSAGTFEDATDADRMGIRRYLCFIALALLEDEYRYMAFVNDARQCLLNIRPNGVYPKEYSMIDIIETIIMLNFDHSQKQSDSALEKLRHNTLLLRNEGGGLSDFADEYANMVEILIENATAHFEPEET